MPTGLQLLSYNWTSRERKGEKKSRAVFKIGILSQRNKARAQSLHIGLKPRRASTEISWTLVTTPTSNHYPRWHHSREWWETIKRQGSTWLSEEPKREVYIFLNLFWWPLYVFFPVLSKNVMGSTNTAEMSHHLLFRVLLYIAYLCNCIWNW